MSKKKSPMSLSLEYLNRLGWTCAIVEKWNAYAGVRQDCFGFADILAYKKSHGIMLVQTTSESNFAARWQKVATNPHAAGWKQSGGRIRIHGWGKNGLREEEL
jgi:hypothetical protein